MKRQWEQQQYGNHKIAEEQGRVVEAGVRQCMSGEKLQFEEGICSGSPCTESIENSTAEPELLCRSPCLAPMCVHLDSLMREHLENNLERRDQPGQELGCCKPQQ